MNFFFSFFVNNNNNNKTYSDSDIQTASKDISLSLVISGLNVLICLLLHCGHSNIVCYLGHTKNPDDDDDGKKY